jgi:hypothetical protein
MRFRSIVGWAAFAACVAGPAVAAGSVEVRYQQPERFADAGETPRERDDNLRVLTDQLQSLAALNLPTDQTLQVEVLDVDLAGYVRHTGRGDLRVVRDDHDSARIWLRYTLVSNGQALRSGDAALSDLASRKSPGLDHERGPLSREKALLASWFTKEFDAARAAAN